MKWVPRVKMDTLYVRDVNELSLVQLYIFDGGDINRPFDVPMFPLRTLPLFDLPDIFFVVLLPLLLPLMAFLIAFSWGWYGTPLHWAVYQGARPEIITLMLDSGASIKAKTTWGFTAYDIAKWYYSKTWSPELLARLDPKLSAHQSKTVRVIPSPSNTSDPSQAITSQAIPPGKHIVISYNHGNAAAKRISEELYERLKSQNKPAWIESQSIKPGESRRDATVSAIENAHVFVALIDVNYIESGQNLIEIHTALSIRARQETTPLNERIPLIIPVILPNMAKRLMMPGIMTALSHTVDLLLVETDDPTIVKANIISVLGLWVKPGDGPAISAAPVELAKHPVEAATVASPPVQQETRQVSVEIKPTDWDRQAYL